MEDSGSQKTRKEPTPSIIPNKGIFLWNYILELAPEGMPDRGNPDLTDSCIYTAQVHWLQNEVKLNPNLPIRLDPDRIGVCFNLQRHTDYTFEWVTTKAPYGCPNYPNRKCRTVVTLVLSPNDTSKRMNAYSYFIEGHGHTEADLCELVSHLEKYNEVFIKNAHAQLPSKSQMTRLGLRDAHSKIQSTVWPQLFQALADKAGSERIYKAYLLDHAANYGTVPELTHDTGLLRDSDFVQGLNNCYKKGRKKIDPVKLELYLNWYSLGYYRLTDEELAQEIEQKCGKIIKPRTLAKRAERLGLTTDRLPGPQARGV